MQVGYPTEDPEAVAKWAAKGVRYFEADTTDYLLRHIYSERREAVKKVFDRMPRAAAAGKQG